MTLAIGVSGILLAEEQGPAAPEPVADAFWIRTFEAQKHLLNGSLDLLFIGDSLTASWLHAGKPVWELEFHSLRVANLGISGDRTEHILYRVLNSPVRVSEPKGIVLLVGTNNLAKAPPESPGETVNGVRAIVAALRKDCPESEIILVSIPPNGFEPETKLRKRVMEANRRLAMLAQEPGLQYLELHDELLDEAGQWKAGLTLDGTHFTMAGYDLFARRLRTLTREILAGDEKTEN
ncbi:MAG: GDSL-type esterase/lipase family protein [Verrucomicrobiota bacterium]